MSIDSPALRQCSRLAAVVDPLRALEPLDTLNGGSTGSVANPVPGFTLAIYQLDDEARLLRNLFAILSIDSKGKRVDMPRSSISE